MEPQFSFGIISSKQFLEKLEAEYSDFDKNPISARYAINCALTSWHLTDWTFHEFFHNDERYRDEEKIIIKEDYKERKKILGLTKFQNALIKQCPELKYMKLVCNGSKHCVLRDAQIINKTVFHKGGFKLGDFCRHGFDVDRFQIYLGENKTIDFESAFLSTMEFWKKFIVQCESL